MELMRRKVLRCIMVCTMIITLIPIKDVVALGSEMPFKDVPSSAWYYSDVKEGKRQIIGVVSIDPSA